MRDRDCLWGGLLFSQGSVKMQLHTAIENPWNPDAVTSAMANADSVDRVSDF